MYGLDAEECPWSVFGDGLGEGKPASIENKMREEFTFGKVEDGGDCGEGGRGNTEVDGEACSELVGVMGEESRECDLVLASEWNDVNLSLVGLTCM